MRNPQEILVLLATSGNFGKVATAEITIKSNSRIFRFLEALSHSLWVNLSKIELIGMSQRKVLRINLQLILTSALFHRL